MGTQTIQPKRLLTRQECAEFLAIGLRTFDRLLADGDIPAVKIGKTLRVRPQALDEFCEARETRLNVKATGKRRGKGA